MVKDDRIAIEFVVLGKGQTPSGAKAAYIIPLDAYTSPEDRKGASFFADSQYVIGGIYTGKVTFKDGKIDTLSKQSSYTGRMANGNWEAAQLAEEVIDNERRYKLAESRARREAKQIGDDIDRLGRIVAKMPHAQRWHAASTLASLIMEASRRYSK